MVAVFLRAMVISFALASSIGMQNVFVFNNAMTQTLPKAGLVSLYVWLADTALTFIAFLGVGGLISRYVWLKFIIMAVGGAVVVWMGFGILRSANQNAIGNDNRVMPLKEAFVGAWVVAFANPQALVDTSVTLGALHSTLTPARVPVFFFGIITATAIWFSAVTLLIGLLKNRLPKKFLLWVNIISGIIVMLYGANLLRRAAGMIWALVH